MVNRAQQLCQTHVCSITVNYGHAMPINLGIWRDKSGIIVCAAPFYGFAHGHSVPISWGSPPTHSD